MSLRRALNAHLAVGSAVLLTWMLLALAAPLIAPVDPTRTHTFVVDGTRTVPPPFEPGQYGYPLGSDSQGRDLWVGVLYGARTTLLITGTVLLARLLVGVGLGAIAGWSAGGGVDRVVSALTDAFASFPTILFAMLWIFAFDIRSGASAFALALALTGWWGFGRSTRAAVVHLRHRPYIEGARVIGLRDWGIFVRHLLPNIAPLLVVATALEAGAILLLLGELAFLGIVVGGGSSIPRDDARLGGGTEFIFATAEWGAILAQGRTAVFSAPWIALVPAAAFASAIFGFTLLGYGLRRLFVDAALTARWLTSRRTVAVAALVGALVWVVPPLVEPAAGFVPIARAFDPNAALTHVAYLADPARGGRRTGSPGYAEAADYMATQFRSFGLEPLAEGGDYTQRYSASVLDLSATPTLELLEPSPRRFRAHTDFAEVIRGAAGGGTAEGRVVYVGSGISGTAFDEYAGLPVQGSVVLIGLAFEDDPVTTALQQGAAAVLLINPTIGKRAPLDEGGERRHTLPVLEISDAVANQLIASSGHQIQQLRRDLERDVARANGPDSATRTHTSFVTNSVVRVSVGVGTPTEVRGRSVIGLLQPPAAQWSGRFVVVGANLDGVGSDPDGTVFPGANDNASGVSVLLELARGLAAHRALLGDAVIFAAFDGGVGQSAGFSFFVGDSITRPWRPANIVGYFDLTQVGCCDGLGASDEAYVLRERLHAAAGRLGYDLAYVETQNVSDHFAYRQRQVPTILVSSGQPQDVQRASDDVAHVDVARLRAAGEVTLLALLTLTARGATR